MIISLLFGAGAVGVYLTGLLMGTRIGYRHGWLDGRAAVPIKQHPNT
jgi:hypothetical protein